MKILLFGATGGTGLELLAQALAQSHTVTAFVRNPAALALRYPLPLPNLRIVTGDILQRGTIDAAMPGHDAVLSTLGIKVLGANTIMSDGTRNIVDAMQQFGVKRFIVETSIGVGDSKGQTTFFFGKIILPYVLKNMFADKEVQENIIRQSNLDWTIVRPGMLTNGIKTGTYRSGLDPSISGRISRADVADFMLRQLTDPTYLRKTPALAV